MKANKSPRPGGALLKLGLSVLASRVSCPDGTIRERALAAWAELLSSHEWERCWSFTLAWLREQRLETRCFDAVLIAYRAWQEGAGLPRGFASKLREAIARPSIASERLLCDLDGAPFAPDLALMFHAKESDPISEALRELQQHVMPWYRIRAAEIDAECDGRFSRHWAQELDKRLVERSIDPADAGRIWGPSSYNTTISRQSEATDALVSAWLATVAWAAHDGILEPYDAFQLATFPASLDPDLWMTRPSDMPGWWSQIADLHSEKSGTIEEVLAALPAGEFPLYARGSAKTDDTDLELLAFTGPVEQVAADVRISWGSAIPIDLRVGVNGAWRVFGQEDPMKALAGRCDIPSMSYQWSRFHRGLWVPARSGDSTLEILCRKRDVIMEEFGNRVATWKEWVVQTQLAGRFGALSIGGVILLPSKSWLLRQLEGGKRLYVQVREVPLDRSDRTKTSQTRILGPFDPS